MEMKNKKISDGPESNLTDTEADGPEFSSVRALNAALDKRKKISASLVQLRRNDPSSSELVVFDGASDEETLHYIEELHKLTEESPNSANCSRTGGSYFSIPSCTSSFDGSITSDCLQNAEIEISDLENNGPAGLLHLSAVSNAIKKPIRIWTSETDQSRKVGKSTTGEAVDAEYHRPALGDVVGHWTLRGNREPSSPQDLNDCLFSVIADQTGHAASELRAETIARLKKNVRSLANRIEKIAELEKCDKISLLIGGARYNGSGPNDAKRVIEKSQNGPCSMNGSHGHPRGHASHPQASGTTESVENYSTTGFKSAFLSRNDQDAVAHMALRTSDAQRAMETLNAGNATYAVHLSPGQLSGPLPQGIAFNQGHQTIGPSPIRKLVLVLRHHAGQQNNPDADVHLFTFYPVIN